jgi:hypothetical protein
MAGHSRPLPPQPYIFYWLINCCAQDCRGKISLRVLVYLLINCCAQDCRWKISLPCSGAHGWSVVILAIFLLSPIFTIDWLTVVAQDCRWKISWPHSGIFIDKLLCAGLSLKDLIAAFWRIYWLIAVRRIATERFQCRVLSCSLINCFAQDCRWKISLPRSGAHGWSYSPPSSSAPSLSLGRITHRYELSCCHTETIIF